MILRVWRIKAGLPAAWVAKVLGISETSLRLYESGRVPMPQNCLERLAKLYKCSVSDLLCESVPLEEPTVTPEEIFQRLENLQKIAPESYNRIKRYIGFLALRESVGSEKPRQRKKNVSSEK